MDAMDDEGEIIEFTVRVTSDKIVVGCSDKSYALSAILAELRNAVDMMQLQVDQYRRLH